MKVAVYDIAVILAWLPAVAFPVVYWRAAWYRTAPGRSVMTLALVIAVVMSLVFATRVLGWHSPEWIRVAIYLLIAGALWFQLGTLISVQRSRRRDRRTLRV